MQKQRKKALDFAKKLNMTLRKEKEATEARKLAARLREEAEKKALRNGDVLNATKKQMMNLKQKQSGALDAIKELENDLSKLNKTAVAMAEKAKDAKSEEKAKKQKNFRGTKESTKQKNARRKNEEKFKDAM